MLTFFQPTSYVCIANIIRRFRRSLFERNYILRPGMQLRHVCNTRHLVCIAFTQKLNTSPPFAEIHFPKTFPHSQSLIIIIIIIIIAWFVLRPLILTYLILQRNVLCVIYKFASKDIRPRTQSECVCTKIKSFLPRFYLQTSFKTCFASAHNAHTIYSLLSEQNQTHVCLQRHFAIHFARACVCVCCVKRWRSKELLHLLTLHSRAFIFVVIYMSSATHAALRSLNVMICIIS